MIDLPIFFRVDSLEPVQSLMPYHKQQSVNHVHTSWDILYAWYILQLAFKVPSFSHWCIISHLGIAKGEIFNQYMLAISLSGHQSYIVLFWEWELPWSCIQAQFYLSTTVYMGRYTHTFMLCHSYYTSYFIYGPLFTSPPGGCLLWWVA